MASCGLNCWMLWLPKQESDSSQMTMDIYILVCNVSRPCYYNIVGPWFTSQCFLLDRSQYLGENLTAGEVIGKALNCRYIPELINQNAITKNISLFDWCHRLIFSRTPVKNYFQNQTLKQLKNDWLNEVIEKVRLNCFIDGSNASGTDIQDVFTEKDFEVRYHLRGILVRWISWIFT